MDQVSGKAGREGLQVNVAGTQRTVGELRA